MNLSFLGAVAKLTAERILFGAADDVFDVNIDDIELHITEFGDVGCLMPNGHGSFNHALIVLPAPVDPATTEPELRRMLDAEAP